MLPQGNVLFLSCVHSNVQSSLFLTHLAPCPGPCRDIGKVVAELDALRGYNASLAIVAKAAPADELVPGLGSVSVFGEWLRLRCCMGDKG